MRKEESARECAGRGAYAEPKQRMCGGIRKLLETCLRNSFKKRIRSWMGVLLWTILHMLRTIQNHFYISYVHLSLLYRHVMTCLHDSLTKKNQTLNLQHVTYNLMFSNKMDLMCFMYNAKFQDQAQLPK
jgi:hypothetical protein